MGPAYELQGLVAYLSAKWARLGSDLDQKPSPFGMRHLADHPTYWLSISIGLRALITPTRHWTGLKDQESQARLGAINCSS